MMDFQLTEGERKIWSPELPTFFKDDVIDPEFELDTYGLDIAKAAQLKLMELIEAEIVIYKDGSLFAAGPIASAKWQELRKAVGL